MYFWWAYFVWLTGSYITGIYFSCCLTFRFNKVPKLLQPMIIAAVLSITLYFKTKYTHDTTSIEYNAICTIQTILIIVYVIACFKDALWKKVLIYIFVNIAASIGEVEVRIISTVIGRELDLYFNDFTTILYFMFCTIQQNFICFSIALIWKKIMGKNIELKQMGGMILFPISQVMLFYYCIRTVYSDSLSENIPGIISLIASVMADIFVFYILINQSEKECLDRKLKEREKLRAIETVRYEELEAKRVEMAKEMIERLKEQVRV